MSIFDDCNISNDKSWFIQKRATFTFTYLLTDEAGLAIDLTGCVASAQIREQPTSTISLLDLTAGNGRIIVTPLLGRIDIKILASDTATLTFGGAIADVFLNNSTTGDAIKIPNNDFIEVRTIEAVTQI